MSVIFSPSSVGCWNIRWLHKGVCDLFSRYVCMQKHPRALWAIYTSIWNFRFWLYLQLNSSLEIHRVVCLGIRANKMNIYHSWRLEAPFNKRHVFKLTILCLWFMIFLLGLILLTDRARWHLWSAAQLSVGSRQSFLGKWIKGAV